MIKYVRDILVYKTSQKLELYSEDEIKEIKNRTEEVSKERLLAIIYELSEVETSIKWSTQKTIMFQTGIIKLCTKQNLTDIDSLVKRIEDIEKWIKSGKLIQNNVENVNYAQKDNKKVDNYVKNREEEKIKKIQIKETETKTEKFWPKVVENLKKSGKVMLYTNLIQTQAKIINDMTVGIEFPNRYDSFW